MISKTFEFLTFFKQFQLYISNIRKIEHKNIFYKNKNCFLKALA